MLCYDLVTTNSITRSEVEYFTRPDTSGEGKIVLAPYLETKN
jgi:hypothetical protein